MTGSTAITTAGAFIEGSACEPIWRIVRAEVARRQLEGGQVRPSVQRALDALRQGAQSHAEVQAMFAREHVSRVETNMPPVSMVSELVSTQEVADRLDVTPTHARRLAAQAGIEPAARNAWRATDVNDLVASRKEHQ